MEGQVELKVKATCWNYIGTETASKPVEEEHENEEAPYKSQTIQIILRVIKIVE